MMRKILTLTAFLIIISVTSLYGQNTYKSIVPLQSKIESVENLLGSGNKLNANKVFYDTKDAEIIIFYYQGSCGDSIESELKISKGTVLEIKIRPKKPQKTLELLALLYNPLALDNLISQDLGKGSSIDFDLTQGIIIKSKKIKEKDMVESYYFIPSKIAIPQCLINQMDSTSKYVISRKSGSSDNNCQTPHYGKIATFFMEEQILSDEYEQLDYLAKHMNNCPNFVGNIVYYTKKGEDTSKTLAYINKIKNYLISEKKISPQRLSFEDYGAGETSYIDIFIKSDELIRPKKK